MTFMGTIADINTALQWVSYQPIGYVPEVVSVWPTAVGGNGHWYEFVPTGRTWEQAKADAEARGGYLATVTSTSEHAFVNSLFSSSQVPWFGGYQGKSGPGFTEPSGGWKWVTGEPWSYTNWSSGEPTNSSGVEDFLHTGWGSSRQWNDYPGTLPASYIIEYDSDPRVPPFMGTATLTVTINDMGDVGVGGPLTDTKTVPINVIAVPDFAPSVPYATQPWVLDQSLNGTGMQAFSITSSVESVHDFRVLPDGKIVAVGAVNDRFAIMRFNADMTLDETFGNGGGTQTDFGTGVYAQKFTIDSQGRYGVVGRNRIVRYTAAGVLDTTFGTNGVTVIDHVGQAYDVAIQADSRIAVVGRDNVYFRVTRLTSSGAIEANWDYDAAGDSGGDWGRALILRDDGDILLAGRAYGSDAGANEYIGFGIVRINASGI